MAEKFLTLMADLDDNSQRIMSDWYIELQNAGFTGVQTPGLPFHISHIGMFAGGRVLFGGPDMNPPKLLQLHDAIKVNKIDEYPWTPHVTILIDEPDVINDALKIFINSFSPFMARITGLHLCVFWPTREIGSVQLKCPV